jgi:hypothetical protein
VPTARRTFTRGENVNVAVRAYQGGTVPVDAVSVRAQIQDTTGKTVFSGAATLAPQEFGFDRSSDFHFALPFARLPAGEFLLSIDAAKGPATARREVRFTLK